MDGGWGDHQNHWSTQTFSTYLTAFNRWTRFWMSSDSNEERKQIYKRKKKHLQLKIKEFIKYNICRDNISVPFSKSTPPPDRHTDQRPLTKLVKIRNWNWNKTNLHIAKCLTSKGWEKQIYVQRYGASSWPYSATAKSFCKWDRGREIKVKAKKTTKKKKNGNFFSKEKEKKKICPFSSLCRKFVIGH